MTDRRRRPKASELAQDRRLINPGYSFGARFPDIAAAEVTVVQAGEGVGGWNRVRRFGLADLPGEYVDCPNPRCYGGGFALGDLLSDAARARRRFLNVECVCVGQEASARGRRRYGLCPNTFEVAIRFTYR
jgi:hypothetical protein